jgi:DNA polymerase-3 subunit delta
MARKSKAAAASSNAKDLLARVREESLRPFYVLWGPERYFVDKVHEILVERVLQEERLKEFAIFRYYGEEVSGREIADLAQSVPLAVEKRLIVIMNADALEDKEAGPVCDYLRNPCGFTCILFLAGPRLPEKTWVRTLRGLDREAFLECAALRKPALTAWVREIGREHSVALGESTIEDLIDTVGNDLGAIAREVEKLALYLGGGKEERGAGKGGFGGLVGTAKEEPFYAFTDALFLKGRLEDALRSLGRMLEQGYPPLLLLSRVAAEIRTIWRIKEALDHGSVEHVLESSKIPAFKRRDYVAAAERYTPQRLRREIRLVLQTDSLLKSSRLDASVHMLRLVTSLCASVRPPRRERTAYRTERDRRP